MNIYQVLGISPTKDKKVIRKAYAGLIRKYHPEEHPEKWKEIHDAYMVAMQRADEDRPLHEEPKPQQEERKPQNAKNRSHSARNKNHSTKNRSHRKKPREFTEKAKAGGLNRSGRSRRRICLET